MNPDAQAAQRFLDVLAPGERVTFQTFGDIGGRKALIQILHGTLSEHADKLAELNARGAGVFWMVNAGDLKGRKASNVLRVRAAFVDLDGSPLEPVQSAPLAPHCIVETSPRRWHAYWRIADCPLADFTPLQKALASRFNADAKVCDLPRVMRLPGFDHRKAAPFQSHLIALCDDRPYTLAQFRHVFGLDTIEPMPAMRTRRKLPDRIPEGKRNETLFNCARGFVQKGIDANQRIQRINAERCDPPLCASEVDTIVAKATSYGAKGCAMIPRALVYSQEWKALPDAGRTIAVLAYCRDDNSDDCTFTLTRADLAGYVGLCSGHTLRDAKRALLAAGILVPVSEPRNTQTGRIPARYAIASKWRFRQVQNMHLAPSAKYAPLQRKQSLLACAPALSAGDPDSDLAA